ncbi:hypothetical protein PISL3812_05384 [Talaromyces islandicus]|uniref:Fe2OG dioxygenase domain-containing protein n=1 Tax=Talaromyces islandicus TaxID=28573 RepID=A0A0U1LYG6_TALIS|nr:hypothetical protein PISL3812_05384 [Talaromyces islandicus]
MASSKLFEGIPPFPDDIPTVSMNTVSLAGLRENDTKAAEQVLAACKKLGFFFLDLRGDSMGDVMIKCIDQLFTMSQEIFGLPESVKRQYLHDIPRSFLGFKPRGAAKTETEEPDRFEWFNLGQDGLMGNTDLQALPEFVTKRISYFKEFLHYSQQIATFINNTLAKQLSLPAETFAAAQRPTELSGTVVRFIKTFASPGAEDLRTSMIHHTDFGSITLLANIIGGLQVLTAGGSALNEDVWRWVRPQPGCLIVNLGDAMVQWTGGALRSNVHRIKYPPGEQRFVDRYSLAVLFRPERNASMKPKMGQNLNLAGVEDIDLTAWEWEVKKAMALSRGEAVVESKGGESVVV